MVANLADGTGKAIDHGSTRFFCAMGSLGQMTDYCVELLGELVLRKEMGERGQTRPLEENDLKVMIVGIEKLSD